MAAVDESDSEVILKSPKRGMRCGDTWSCHCQLINIRQEKVNRMLMGHDSFVFHRVQSGDVCVWETSAPSVKCAMKSRTPQPKPQTRHRLRVSRQDNRVSKRAWTGSPFFKLITILCHHRAVAPLKSWILSAALSCRKQTTSLLS